MTLNINLTTPTKKVWDGSAEEVILPSTNGNFRIIRGHAPFLTFLDISVMRIRIYQEWIPIFVMGGFAEVENDQITILANDAQRGDEIDADLAEAELEKAQTSLLQAKNSLQQVQATHALKLAKARAIAAFEFPRWVHIPSPTFAISAQAVQSVSHLELSRRR